MKNKTQQTNKLKKIVQIYPLITNHKEKIQS